DEGLAEPVGGVGVDVAAVGDIGEDALVADTVGAPADGPDVGVVETVLVLSLGLSGIGGADPLVQCGVAGVGVVVVRRSLPGRVGLVADDVSDVGVDLAVRAFVVGGDAFSFDGVVVFGHLKGVAEDNSVEGHIGRLNVLMLC